MCHPQPPTVSHHSRATPTEADGGGGVVMATTKIENYVSQLRRHQNQFAARAPMAVPSPPSSPRRAGAGHDSGSPYCTSIAGIAAIIVGSLGLTSEQTLGIDLGTTFSVAAICSQGTVAVVELEDGIVTLPSVVHYQGERSADGKYGAREWWQDALLWYKATRGVDRNDDVIVGAPQFRNSHPSSTVYDAKRLLGRRFDDPVVTAESEHLPFEVVADGDGFAAFSIPLSHDSGDDGRNDVDKQIIVSPSDVGAAILKKLKRAAESVDWIQKLKRTLGFKYKSLTVSVPVGFTINQKKATLKAGKAAGFKLVRLLEEPVAAAIAFGLLDEESESDSDKLVLVYDRGGGTLDVAVLRLDKQSNTFLVMGSSGDDRLGGEDFDRALMGWFLEKVKVKTPSESSELPMDPIDLRDSRLHESMLKEMEHAKRRLSEVEMVEVTVFWRDETRKKVVAVKTDDAIESEAHTSKITITRQDLEHACSDLLSRSLHPVNDALKRAGNVQLHEIQNVVLVGGSSRLVSVRERLVDIFGTQRVLAEARGPDPETAVAVGAARSYAC